ncbi:chromosome transmission fidelity protein 18 homolog [Rhynchophorus ferrugineus]|uniref:chromosome transmission fidelity protein 18 homolog n=1 Tax=Rhynchophorus ferrugineus TaxID=354439 RepID=UPI003FCDD92D
MDGYPNSDEEFELMYGDELELLNEQDNEDEYINRLPQPKVRKSLNFDAPSSLSNVHDDPNSSIISGCHEIADESVQKDDYESTVGEMEINVDNNILSTTQSTSNSRKRTVEALFGDIEDLLDIDIEEYSAPKRVKADEKCKKDLELIDLIIRKRNDYKTSNNLGAIAINISGITSDAERNKHNISREVPKYPFIRIKDFSKENVYIRFHSEAYEKEESRRIVKEHSFQGVLGESFKKVWSEATSLISIEPVQSSTENADINMLEETNHDNQLWVELYKPRKYFELLSDESTNRTILRWIKLWDKVVFNRNPKIKVTPVVTDNKKRFFNFNELNTKLDEHGRPENKVVLLCGPPGLGKTTLAHMVAKHAGYNVVEINASDDRSVDAFRTALETATQMRSVIDQERRPNCIVFDEIDGAPQTSIDYLVKFIQGTASKTKKGKNKDKPEFILKRPIICICNDVYVPALRPLKQIAFVINFPQTSSVRLAERLVEICRRQQIKTDMGPMTALAEKSNNDIRSCLSVLHFFKSQNKPIGLSDIYKASIGQKDMQKGLFAIWREIFEIKRLKKPTGGNSAPTLKERMQDTLNAVGSFGDHERVAQGVFENFPLLNIKDTNMEETSQALDWFCFNDIFNKYIYTTQNYSLWGYLDYAFVVWHFAFASFQKQKLIYPSAGFEARAKEIRQKAVVAEVLRGMAPSTRCYNAFIPLLLDVLPLLIRIISPPFRPVSLHLYNDEEKRNLLHVASIMADYNLNYIQERKSDGIYEYNLEPNIEDLVIFDKAGDRRKLPSYSNKQLISREIEMEKMRRFEVQSGSSIKPTDLKKSKIQETKKAEVPTKEEKAAPKKSPDLPNHLQKLKSKALNKDKILKPSVRKDFFGRIIECPVSSTAKSTQHVAKNDIWYQYKEGFSNAVRKKIKISALK